MRGTKVKHIKIFSGDVRNRLLSSTVALQEKLMNIINMDSDTEPVRNMLADTLDCFVGITEGVLEVHFYITGF